MNTQEIIQDILHKRNKSLNKGQIATEANKILNIIINSGGYNFSVPQKTVYTQQKKQRIIYSYTKSSHEDILCQYLKIKIDDIFHIKYASRDKIINLLFNILPTISKINDFVIIKADFKSFFDSVLTEHVYNKYILESSLKRFDKELLKQYIKNSKYCYSGLCLSNGFTEIVCRDFDDHLRARLSKYGVFFYERYVDDIILITNRFITQDDFKELAKSTIKEVFGTCPVKLNEEKFSYLSRREFNGQYVFSFLGYAFQLIKNKKDQITFNYGISDNKQKKYKGLIERAILNYKKDNNVELFRQRIKIYSSRIVIAHSSHNARFEWITKGFVENYKELRNREDDLIKSTKDFLCNTYMNLLKEHNIKPFDFIVEYPNTKKNSIYNLYSNITRNRTIIFEEKIGVSKKTLVRWIQKLTPSYHYNPKTKSYYGIVMDYLDMIKIK